MALRYYYQVDVKGNPIPGSNMAKIKKPTSYSAGHRWVEYIPAAKTQPCCTNDTVVVTSLNHKWRYYVRLSGSTSLPIDGTLEKRQQKPDNYFWQEIVGKRQCATVPQFNATFSTNSDDNLSFNILTSLGLSDVQIYESGAKTTDNGNYHLIVNHNGTIAITGGGSGSDTITLHYGYSDCLFAFQLTITQ